MVNTDSGASEAASTPTNAADFNAEAFINDAVQSVSNLNYSDWGNGASIAGLMLSGLTIYLVFGLRKRVLFGAGIDDHLTSLRDIASSIFSLLNSFEGNESEIEREFGIVNVKLRNLKGGAYWPLPLDIWFLRARIWVFRRRYRVNIACLKPNVKAATIIHTDISCIVQHLLYVRKEKLAGK